MYLWNIKALKQELAANTLTEPQLFVYFLAMLTLDTLVYESIPLFPGTGDTNVWDYVGYVGSVVFTVGGALVAYLVNGGSTGKNFLTRYFPLMWVLTVRFLVFVIPVFGVAMFLMFNISEALFGTETAGEDSAALSRYVVILGWAYFLAFYYRLAVHLRDVARAA
jgi:hypothetical protein